MKKNEGLTIVRAFELSPESTVKPVKGLRTTRPSEEKLVVGLERGKKHQWLKNRDGRPRNFAKGAQENSDKNIP